MIPEKQHRAFGTPEFVTNVGNADRAAHLESIRRIREGIDPKADTAGKWGGVELSIPELDYAILQARFPDLTSLDAEIRTKAWKKFAKSPEAEPYRTYRIKRGPQCRSTTVR